jgi:flagellar basal-body rod modification protein FlgD
MQTSSINSISTQISNTDQVSRVPQKILSQDDFLKLLVTQLANQDPLNPVKDTDFIAQMSQFSVLEQIKSLGSGIDQLRSEESLNRANSLLGQTVVITTDSDETITGIVDAVDFEAGTPQLIVNGQTYPLSQLQRIIRPQT